MSDKFHELAKATAQPVALTTSVQLRRAPDTTAPAQFFRLLRK